MLRYTQYYNILYQGPYFRGLRELTGTKQVRRRQKIQDDGLETRQLSKERHGGKENGHKLEKKKRRLRRRADAGHAVRTALADGGAPARKGESRIWKMRFWKIVPWESWSISVQIQYHFMALTSNLQDPTANALRESLRMLLNEIPHSVFLMDDAEKVSTPLSHAYVF